MTAITSPTEISVTDLPFNVKTGTGKRRVLVAIRATSEGVSDTVNVATWVPGASDIEGLVWDTKDNAIVSTASTWSTTTLTTADGGGAYEIGVIVNLT